MASVIHVGDVGTTVEATITKDDGSVLDLQNASVKQLKFKFSSTVIRDAVFVTDGSDGKVKYITVHADLVFNKAGAWKIQGYVEIPSAGKWNTAIATVTVEANL